MTGYLFYIAALTGLIVSFVADRRKTSAALIKAWQTVLGILPELVGILVLIGIALAFPVAATLYRTCRPFCSLHGFSPDLQTARS